MQREIKFRAKGQTDGKWHCGLLVFLTEAVCHIKDKRTTWICDAETLGQYTGLNDSKRTEKYPDGQEIYEGDVLKVKTNWYKAKGAHTINDAFGYSKVKGETYWTIEYKIFGSEMGYMAYGIDRRFHKRFTMNMIYNNEAEAIGNIYEDPELLTQSPTSTEQIQN